MNSFSQKLLAFFLFILTLPVYPFFYLFIKTSARGPFIFRQTRVGKNKKLFVIYKFRTMVEDAEKLKSKYSSLNEAQGPVFKIRDDPRYTKVGMILARSSMDELPQLINVIKGEMAFVGPRPLPVNEGERIPKKYNARYTVLPGLTSPWVIKGGHNLTFTEWMDLDVEYVKSKNIWYDVRVLFQTGLLVIRSWFHLHD